MVCCVVDTNGKRDTRYNDGTGKGVNFRVVDVDTFRFNEVVGRCFCPATVMQQAMESNTPIVMSLGEECAEIALSIASGTISSKRSSTAIRLHYSPVHNLAEAVCPSVLAQTASESSRCWCTDR